MKLTSSQRSKQREIADLETFISRTKSEVLQKIAGDRIRELIKGLRQ